ncbi:MAG: 2-hydroxychromene-2-carboxylate isomerase [Pseudomonadota bacterium]
MIEYYLSLNSPWTFLGGARLHGIAQAAGLTVDVRPIDAGQVFPVSGGLPLPKRAPQRQAYRLMDLDRWRRFLDIPLILEPEHFPSAEGEAARLVVAAALEGHDALALATAFGQCIWVEDRSFAEPAVQADVLSAHGLDFGQLSERAGAEDVTATLERYTEEAIQKQVFGMPSYIFQGELFWGQDRLDFLERAVNGAV